MGHFHGVGGLPHRGLMLRAAATSVFLSILFVVTYGGTNWLTAQRPSGDVQSWYFAWELTHIPYVPLLIVPYMSMDLLFFFATFLCRDERELKTYAKRVVFSILIAAAFFLLMPLRLHWPVRPHVEGWFGDFVEHSCTAPFLMEYPHNLFPSLHITLCLIVADSYTRHTRGIVRVVLVGWFFVIGVSTLLTWQHHIIDIAGGLVLAGFAFYAVREEVARRRRTWNMRVGSYYAAGGLAILMLAPELGPWGAFLLWPAAALEITASEYFGVGSDIFRKTDGRLPWSTRFVLAPILLGHYLSLLYYRRQCRAWDEVAPGVLIGRALTDVESANAMNQGVTAVLDLTAEIAEATPFLNAAYKNIPVLDLTAPTREQMREAVDFIAEEAARGIVYVHCKIGYSRSAAIVGAYLLNAGLAQTVDEAVALLRQARPTIVIRLEALAALREYAMWLANTPPRSRPCVPRSRRAACLCAGR